MNQQTIDNFLEEYNEVQRTFQERAREKMKEIFKEFWQANPDVNVITWTQYAPYFNDGDPCVFSVNDLTFSNATEEDDIKELNWGDYDGENEDVWSCGSWGAEVIAEKVTGINVESVKDLCKFMHSDIMKDVLESVFGSDNRVVAIREGFISKDYSGNHD